ncbi:MAG TPA: ATP-binding protein [Chloroflexota bacterium]|nr:ATP-binding protein [Chloroflexota bacterium]
MRGSLPATNEGRSLPTRLALFVTRSVGIFSVAAGATGVAAGLTGFLARRWLRAFATAEVQDEAAQERARFAAVLATSPAAIIFVDAESRHVNANARASAMFGHSFDPATGPEQYAHQLLDSDGNALRFECLPSSRVLAGETIVGEELRIRRPDGQDVPVVIDATPVLGPDDRLLGAAVTFLDISRLKESERLREEWISMVAHDLRSPITAIIGFTSFLQRLPPERHNTEDEQRAIAHMYSSGHRLNRMIEDLLEVSFLASRRLSLEREPTDVVELTRSVVARMASQIDGREIRVTITGEIPIVAIDPARVEQVLTNLLSNAAKYGYPATPIDVEIEGTPTHVKVSITNHGVGIRPDDMPHIFERFRRASVRPAGVPGLGLGLYIVRELVNAHGGRVWAESSPGETTTFHFLLPVGGSD